MNTATITIDSLGPNNAAALCGLLLRRPPRPLGISGNTVVAATPNATIGSNKYQGAVYVFVKPRSGWADMTQTAKLTASDGAYSDALGSSVAISGNTVIAGAPNVTVGSNQYQGAAYVFVKPASGWADTTQTAKLLASDGAFHDQFGQAVSISGNTAVIGALYASIGSHRYQGAAYVFVKPKQGWKNGTQTAKLTASDGMAYDALATSVAISGATVAAGRHTRRSAPILRREQVMYS